MYYQLGFYYYISDMTKQDYIDYPGVSYDKSRDRYRCEVSQNGKRKKLKTSVNPKVVYEALVAYRTKQSENRESNERFVPINGYGGRYFISEKGRILNINNTDWYIMEHKVSVKGCFVKLKTQKYRVHYLIDLLQEHFSDIEPKLLDHFKSFIKEKPVVDVEYRKSLCEDIVGVYYKEVGDNYVSASRGKRFYDKCPQKVLEKRDLYKASLLPELMGDEEWLPVKGYEDSYIISNMGRLVNINIVKEVGSITKDGYLHHGSLGMINVLVAEAFLGFDRDSGKMVDHIDPKKKTDNSLYNLQVISNRLNQIKDKPSFKTGMYNITYVDGKYLVKYMHEKKYSYNRFHTIGEAKEFRNNLDKELGDWFFSWIE